MKTEFRLAGQVAGHLAANFRARRWRSFGRQLGFFVVSPYIPGRKLPASLPPIGYYRNWHEDAFDLGTRRGIWLYGFDVTLRF